MNEQAVGVDAENNTVKDTVGRKTISVSSVNLCCLICYDIMSTLVQ